MILRFVRSRRYRKARRLPSRRKWDSLRIPLRPARSDLWKGNLGVQLWGTFHLHHWGGRDRRLVLWRHHTVIRNMTINVSILLRHKRCHLTLPFPAMWGKASVTKTTSLLDRFPHFISSWQTIAWSKASSPASGGSDLDPTVGVEFTLLCSYVIDIFTSTLCPEAMIDLSLPWILRRRYLRAVGFGTNTKCRSQWGQRRKFPSSCCSEIQAVFNALLDCCVTLITFRRKEGLQLF